VIVALLAATFALTAWSEPRWCCDAGAYYMYLRSAVFDGDFNFWNEWVAFGVKSPEIASTGLANNAASIGPAILWAPFVLLAHLYVIAVNSLGLGWYEPTGYSAPYLLATAAGTNVVVVLGIRALWTVCSERFSRGVSTVAVLFGLLTSTLPYYVFVVPSGSHGLVFGATAMFLALWTRVEKRPSSKGWVTLALWLGVISLLRWQAVVLGLMFVPLFVDGFRRRAARWWWAPAAVLTSAVTFLPQAGAWWVLFGSPFAIPTQFHGMDWTAPHLVDVLFSADRGLFTWTPAMMIGCLGWVWLARSWPAFTFSAAAVFLVTAWVNGGVAAWSGADAFGARRFDLLIPLWTVGFAAMIQASVRLLERWPLVAPAAALSIFALWNIGLIRLHRNGVFTEAAPFEEVAARQATAVRKASEDWLGRIAGPRGRNFAYRAFVGRYFYWNIGFDGRIDLSLPSVPYLSGSWSERIQEEDQGAYRFAGQRGACAKIPLERTFDLPVVVTARATVEEQTMSLSANGRTAGQAGLPMVWTDVPFLVPAASLNPGENLVCLGFTRARRNERAAAVQLIQLP
jgi:hypothetical protein